MQKVNIVQGEHAVVAEPDVMLSTLLGSCVAVCLHDSVARVGGMNHFLLAEPEDPSTEQGAMQRYGVHAMELLINAMMKRGARRERMKANIYGGANMIAAFGSIGSENGEFARRFMENEGIPVGHCDIGGNAARRVEFLPYEGKVRSVSAGVPAPIQKPQVIATNDVELF